MAVDYKPPVSPIATVQTPSRASPTPTGDRVVAGFEPDASPIVGAGLLAIAVDQITGMLDVQPPSRAGSLPQGGRVVAGFEPDASPIVGASLLAIAVGQITKMLDVQRPSRAGSHTGGSGGRWICARRHFHCASLLAMRPRFSEFLVYWCCTCTIEFTCTRACICSAPPPRRMPRTGQASR